MYGVVATQKKKPKLLYIVTQVNNPWSNQNDYITFVVSEKAKSVGVMVAHGPLKAAAAECSGFLLVELRLSVEQMTI